MCCQLLPAQFRRTELSRSPSAAPNAPPARPGDGRLETTRTLPIETMFYSAHEEHNETPINDARHRRREILRRQTAAVSTASAAPAACVFAAIAASVAGASALSAVVLPR